jgi:stage III sporulation protein SpoIIIAA
MEDVARRPILKELMEDGVFRRFVILRRGGGSTTEMTVYNERKIKLWGTPGSSPMKTGGGLR